MKQENKNKRKKRENHLLKQNQWHGALCDMKLDIFFVFNLLSILSLTPFSLILFSCTTTSQPTYRISLSSQFQHLISQKGIKGQERKKKKIFVSGP